MTREKMKSVRRKAKAIPSSTVRDTPSPHQGVPLLPLFSEAEVHQMMAHVCAICDDGGDLVICDGICLRQFHRNHESLGAEENKCPTVHLQTDH
jgi:hypothetical protein